MTAKQDLITEVARLRAENDALRDLLTAAGEGAKSPAYVVGYLHGIGKRGGQDAAQLREHAAWLRQRPSEDEGSRQ